MRTGLTAVGRQLAGTLRHLAGQIVVSVVTAVSVAFITNAYLKSDAASDPHPRPAATSSSVRAEPQDSATGTNGGKSNASVAPSTAEADARPAHSPRETLPALPKLEAVYVPTVPSAPGLVVDAARPSLRAGSAEIVDVTAAPTAAPEEPRRRLFGIPLPRPLADLGAVRNRVTGFLEDGDEPSGPGLH